MQVKKGNSSPDQQVFSCSGTTQAQANKFIIRKLGASAGDPSVEVDFSPIFPKNSTDLQNVFPVFDTKGKFFLPAFSIPSDKEKSKDYQALYQAIHFKKVIQANQEKNQMYVPKPSKKNRCCIVCKTLFDDYLTHVNTPTHQKNTKLSPFNTEIIALCQKFQNANSKNQPVKKSTKASQGKRTYERKSKKGQSSETIDQAFLNQKPRKKRKTENKVDERKNNLKHQENGCASTMFDTDVIFQSRTDVGSVN